MPTDFQRRLRVMRRLHDISQRQLGNEVGLTASSISNYEIGRPPSPQRARQLRIALNRLVEKKEGNHG